MKQRFELTVLGHAVSASRAAHANDTAIVFAIVIAAAIVSRHSNPFHESTAHMSMLLIR